jgi:hypothetical protein
VTKPKEPAASAKPTKKLAVEKRTVKDLAVKPGKGRDVKGGVGADMLQLKETKMECAR